MKMGKLDVNNFPNLLILDSEHIAAPRFGLSRPLKHLLAHYQLPRHDLHNAGNDANFALKLLLMLAVDDGTRMGTTLEGRAKLWKDIARTPSAKLPPHLTFMGVDFLVASYAG
jgi:hypothetical protein